jgi:hypothetical protein
MALIDERAAAASQAGGTLSPDGVQVAGIGRVLFEIFSALNKQPGRVRQTVDEQRLAPDQGRIPTSAEERLIEPGEYRARQEQQAPDLLSPEGLKRFKESDYRATEAITPPPAKGALDALDDTVVQPGAGATDTGAVDEMGLLTGPQLRPGVGPQVDDFIRASDDVARDGLDFNFENLETGDDVKAMINKVSEIFANPIEAAKRGVVTQKETLAEAEQLLADEMGFTRNLLKRKRGVPFNAAEATASRIVMVRSIERLMKMAQSIADGERSPAALLSFRRQMAVHAGIQAQVKGMQTEIARAMNAFNIPVSARTPEMQADVADAMLKDTGGSAEAVKLAKGLLSVQKSGGNAAAHKFALKGFMAKANGVFGEVYVNGLLSWTYTQLKNLLATPSFMIYQTVEEVIAGVYGGVERGIGKTLRLKPEGVTRAGLGSTADGVYAGQAAARMFGMARSIEDAWITAAETFRKEIPADALSKIEGAQLRAIDAETLEISGPWGKFIDMLGRTIRLPGRGLMAVDDFWRVFAQRGELSAEAYAQAMRAKSLGKSDEEAFDNFAMSMLDPRSYANQVDEAARYNSLTTDTGLIGEATAFIQNLPVIGRLLLPFTKVPVNSVLRVMERFAPIGLLKDPVKRQKALARVTLAYGAMYMLQGYAADGRLTGSMPTDQRQRDMLPPGWRPYSLVFKGDKWPKDADGDDMPIFDPRTGAPNGALIYVSYAGLEPVGAIIGISASVAERMRRTNDPEAQINYAGAAIAAAAQYFEDMPMVAVLGDIAKAIRTGDLTGIAASPLRGMMPFSAAVRAGERAVDPTIRKASGQPQYYTIADVEDANVTAYRDLGGGETEPRYELVGRIKGGLGASFNDAMDKWGSMLTDRVLFGGADDDTSAIKYDVFGDVRDANVRFDINPVHALYNMIIPFNVRHGEALTDVQYEQIRLKGPLRDTRRRDDGFGFSEAFRSEWTRAAKREVKTISPVTGEAADFKGSLNNLIGSVEYLAMTDKEQFRAIRNLENRFYDAGLEMVFDMDQYAHVREAYEDYQMVKSEDDRQGRLRR